MALLSKRFVEAGLEVVSVRELNKGIKDERVIQLALQHNYLLLTEDFAIQRRQHHTLASNG